jgi:fructuronate reductase
MLSIGCLQRCLVAPEDPVAVLDLLASPSVRIVSLTVTEKGYCYQPATRALDLENVDIVHDLHQEHAKTPRSAIGFLVQALKIRREVGVEPFTVVSCDNLPHNGKTLADICVAFAQQLDPNGDLAKWIASSVCFPSTMVDCIAPATKEADIAKASVDLLGGLRDEAMVVCEPFRQWVIQDCFGPLGRPPWEQVGAQLVQDVATFEDAKLCILNGCHSTLAYSGFLCGIEYIWQVMAREPFQELGKILLECDVLPVLAAPEGVDLEKYARTVLGRFENTALEHRTFQIAMDGSQKLPQRLLQTARRQLEQPSGKLQVIPFAVAAWMRYVSRLDEHGAAIRVQDPLAETFASIAVTAKGDAREVATKLLAVKSIFGDDILVQAKERFVEPIIMHLEKLMKAVDEEAVYAYLSEFVDSIAIGRKRARTE